MSSFDFAGDTRERAGISRRDILKGIAAASAGALVSSRELLAQAKQSTAGPIDIHQHIGGTLGGEWSVQKVLDLIGKNGISTVIFSNAGSGDQLYTGTESGRTFARKCNE